MRAKTIMLVASMLAAAGGTEARAQGYTVTDLGTLGGSTGVFAINDSGQAAGTSRAAAGHRAYRYSGGTMRNLGTIGGPAGRTFAFGMNASGHVVGAYDRGPGTTNGVFFHDEMGLIEIGTLGGTFATAHDINAAGVIVGHRQMAAGGPERAFLYSAGVVTDPGHLRRPSKCRDRDQRQR